MKKPTISVLICTYNRKELLRRCLESLKTQTFKDFEIIVVDDGSTDGSEELKDLVDVYDIQPHRGISALMNRTLELMNGEYFFVIGSDDKLMPTALEEHLDRIKIDDKDYVFSYLEYFGSGVKEGNVEQYYPQNFKECYRMKKIPHPGLYRVSTLGKFRYDTSLHSAVDYDYILNILSSYPTIKMDVIKKPLYIYRIGHKQERGTSAQIIAVGIIRNKYRRQYETKI